MIAHDQPLSALQPPKDGLRIRAPEEHITQNIDHVISRDPAVPGFDHAFIHGLHIRERPAAQRQNMFVAKMGVCDIVIHGAFLSFDDGPMIPHRHPPLVNRRGTFQAPRRLWSNS